MRSGFGGCFVVLRSLLEGRLAQMVRAPVLHTGGPQFDPVVAHHARSAITNLYMTTDEKRAAYDALPSAAKKRVTEMKIFKGFAHAANLGVDLDSEKNEEPPAPDISCTIQGAPRFYELGEITDEHLARDLSINGVSSTGVFFNEQGLLTRMLCKKGISSYQTNGVPMDLILHYDKQFPFEDPNGYLQEADVVAALLPNGPFSRIWIYDSWADTVLWSR